MKPIWNRNDSLTNICKTNYLKPFFNFVLVLWDIMKCQDFFLFLLLKIIWEESLCFQLYVGTYFKDNESFGNEEHWRNERQRSVKTLIRTSFIYSFRTSYFLMTNSAEWSKCFTSHKLIMSECMFVVWRYVYITRKS